MPIPGPRTTYRYSKKFKAAAVRFEPVAGVAQVGILGLYEVAAAPMRVKGRRIVPAARSKSIRFEKPKARRGQ